MSCEMRLFYYHKGVDLMKGIFRKTLAAALALTVVGGGMPPFISGNSLFGNAIVANAEDIYHEGDKLPEGYYYYSGNEYVETTRIWVSFTYDIDNPRICIGTTIPPQGLRYEDVYVNVPDDRILEEPAGVRIASGNGTESSPYRLELVYADEPVAVDFEEVTVGKKWYIGDMLNTDAYFKLPAHRFGYSVTADEFYGEGFQNKILKFYRKQLTSPAKIGYFNDSNYPELTGFPLWVFENITTGSDVYNVGYNCSVEELRSLYYAIAFSGDANSARGIEVTGGSGTKEDPFTIEPIFDENVKKITFISDVRTVTGYTDGDGKFTIPQFYDYSMRSYEGWQIGDKIYHPNDTVTLTEDSTAVAVLDLATQIKEIKFSHNVSLGNDLSIVYYVPATGFGDCTDIKLTLKKEFFDANGNMTYKTTTLNAGTPVDKGYGPEYEFRFKGISAKEMGSNVTATLSVKKDGETFTSPEDVYSIKQYAMNKLNNSGTQEKLKKLLVDMLNYGAQAQQYFGYNTGDLVNKSLTDEQKALATSFDTITVENHEAVKKMKGARARFTGKNLNLGNNIGIVYFMEFNSDVDTSKVKLQLHYTNALGENKTLSIPYSSFTKGDYENELRYDFTGLSAKDSMQRIRAVIREDDVTISDTLYYSIPTYASKKLANSTNESLKEIIRSMMVYYTSAKNYFA